MYNHIYIYIEVISYVKYVLHNRYILPAVVKLFIALFNQYGCIRTFKTCRMCALKQATNVLRNPRYRFTITVIIYDVYILIPLIPMLTSNVFLSPEFWLYIFIANLRTIYNVKECITVLNQHCSLVWFKLLIQIACSCVL